MTWPCCKKKEEDETHPRKPSNSKFKQQKLPAWQPIITATTVLPVFFLFGAVCLPIGITLYVKANNVAEQIFDYTDCCVPPAGSANCKCIVKFKLNKTWEGDVFFYYGLSNFYQNHRRYVRSRDDGQLHGELSQSVNANCEPFDYVNGTAVAPCGAIANSMFNDTFKLKSISKSSEVPFTYEDITWKSDLDTKFQNPKNMSMFDSFVKPSNWPLPANQLDVYGDSNNGFQNRDFIVWMRVAAFPTFRKLYRKLDRADKNAVFNKGLPYGEYELTIMDNYPVKSFGGKKRFILSQASWAGGKNLFLGTVYIIVGVVCLVFGFLFLIVHTKYRTRAPTSN